MAFKSACLLPKPPHISLPYRAMGLISVSNRFSSRVGLYRLFPKLLEILYHYARYATVVMSLMDVAKSYLY